MHDDTATVAELKAMMAAFVAERGWEAHHRPKHLAMSIAIEAAELMEHFQWTDAEGGLRDERFGPAEREAVAEELSDVLAYTLSFANAMGIDVASAFEAKLAKNRAKYPA